VVEGGGVDSSTVEELPEVQLLQTSWQHQPVHRLVEVIPKVQLSKAIRQHQLVHGLIEKGSEA
jgi:hypothetical protein